MGPASQRLPQVMGQGTYVESAAALHRKLGLRRLPFNQLQLEHFNRPWRSLHGNAVTRQRIETPTLHFQCAEGGGRLLHHASERRQGCLYHRGG